MSNTMIDMLVHDLVGTDQALGSVLAKLGVQGSPEDVEVELARAGLAACAGCGTWSFIDDEYCYDCEGESE